MREIKFEIGIENMTGEVCKVILTIDELLEKGLKCKDAVDILWKRQYTGLKDKNGVEIYEGDIVDCWDSVDVLSQKAQGVGIIGTVDFNGGCFCVKNCDGYHNRLALTCAENVEVIGNVHQNPELLD